MAQRKGFRGGGMDASTKSFDAPAAAREGRQPIGREDRSGKTGNFQIANQGFTADQVANQNLSNVSGSDFTRAAERIKFQNRKTKEYPTYLPGGLAYKFARNLLGTPKTKFGQRDIIKRRQAYINNIKDPKLRADMIKELDLGIDPIDNRYGDPTILGAGDYGKNLYGIDALDIINYDGEYMKQYGPKPFDGGGNDNILPQYAMMGGGADMGSVDVEEEKTFDYHLGKDGQGIGRDVRLGYLAKGGRAGKAEGGIMGTRARRAMGGIMERVDKRQGYFLGKLVKKVGNAAKKVLSSDIGKMAIAGAAIYYGGGGGNPFTQKGRDAFSFFGNKSGGGFFSKSNPLLFSTNDAGKQKFNPWKMAGLITAGGAMAGPAKVDTLPGMNNRGGHLIDPITGQEALPSEMRASLNNALDNADGDPIRIKQINDAYAFLGPDERLGTYSPYRTYGVKDGGRINKAEGGLMDLGGMEKDYRAEGGFVPIGEYEKKDDVPARLSVNEFVFTADAVRGAGGGDIDKGAEIMENMMVNLEKGGTVSEESQGNAGAQQMFDTSERLGEVI